MRKPISAILGAPVRLLADDLLMRSAPAPLGYGGGPSVDLSGLFLKLGAVHSIIAVIAGVYFTYSGATGNVKIDLFGNELTTSAIGVALMFMGLVAYYFIGRAALDHLRGEAIQNRLKHRKRPAHPKKAE